MPSTTSVPTIQFASNGILGNIGAPLRDFEDESEEALLGDFETDEWTTQTIYFNLYAGVVTQRIWCVYIIPIEIQIR